MAVFKCKMCGASLDVREDERVVTCRHCDTAQTLPKLIEPQAEALYDRAGHFRRNNEYDKAAGIYEHILLMDQTDAEAYWSLVLCRFGVEYVEDPVSRKRIPTVNRTQYTSVFDDANYQAALQHATPPQRILYETEAAAINEIQKGILEVSQKEEPFDIFLCYKESDHNGRRTPDSVIAQELYYQLTNEGFKVFFARITLEDKLGIAYEPYIFAALNSAKVMIALGTCTDHFNAVWVKNEWSRFLVMAKNGAKKVLIPAYKNMDAYELPDEFAHLQAQDMNKIGFEQDLIRGIKKILQAAQPAQSTPAADTSVIPLLKRVFMMLEDGDFNRADELCEQALNIDPENPRAYVAKLLIENRLKSVDELADLKMPFGNSPHFQKVMRFGDDTLKTSMQDHLKRINERNREQTLQEQYNKATVAMERAQSEEAFLMAAKFFEAVGDYRDAVSRREECVKKGEEARAEAMYRQAVHASQGSYSEVSEAIGLFSRIPTYRDSAQRADACKMRLEELKRQEDETRRLQEEKQRLWQEEEARRLLVQKKKRKIRGILGSIAMAFLIAIIAGWYVHQAWIVPQKSYREAMVLFENGDFADAYTIFRELGNYRNSEQYVKDIEKTMQLPIGISVKFGTYEQNPLVANKEGITWQVIESKDGKALIISDYILECKPFHDTYCEVTWEGSSLREWLNDDFYNTSFSEKEKEAILTTGADKLFLLNVEQATIYFSSNYDRLANMSYATKDTGNGSWWLRDNASSNDRVSAVYKNGAVYNAGYAVTNDEVGVRPAMWVDLKEFDFAN